MLEAVWLGGEPAIASSLDRPVLVLLDEADRLGASGPAVIEAALAFCDERPGARIVVAGVTDVLSSWPLPAPFVRHRLRPLLEVDRAAFLMRRGSDVSDPARENALGAAAASPSLFALALATDRIAANAPDLVDAWLEANAPRDERDAIAREAFAQVAGTGDPARAPSERDRLERLAARHLAGLAPTETARHVLIDPPRWTPVLAHLAERVGPDEASAIAAHLLDSSAETPALVALAAAELLARADVAEGDTLRDVARARLVDLLADVSLPPTRRAMAGEFLAAWGDLRDLKALIEVPEGTVTMGCAAMPNASPPHALRLPAYRIGAFPVTNALYARFAAETGRAWASPDKARPTRATAPATDLTWHDARAFCDWATAEWRASGRIGADETVRLPTEPEWERAARGDAPDAGDTIVYPWGTAWRDDACNGEEAGFNATTPAGLFAAGRSPFGVWDMAGQVWEWTSTLWGSDMAAPSYRYPYDAHDGREEPYAGPDIRRVLRGGCFSSGRLKANVSYRGSLEPGGRWRGNGFRVVAAQVVRT